MKGGITLLSTSQEPFGRGPVITKMMGICLRYGCIECCLNTEMPLSGSDVIRIEGLGFSENFFIIKKKRNRQLRNLSGRCVFHNGQLCTIYLHRPEGCQLYPAIFHEDTGEVMLDSCCPHHGKFRLTPSISRRVIKLVRKLDVEKIKGARDLRKEASSRHSAIKPSAY